MQSNFLCFVVNLLCCPLQNDSLPERSEEHRGTRIATSDSSHNSNNNEPTTASTSVLDSFSGALQRSCPVCDVKFPTHVTEETMCLHINNHFDDNNATETSTSSSLYTALSHNSEI